MSILAWIVLGLIVGFLASAVMRGGGYGLVGDVIIGIVGALLGGFIFSVFGGSGVTGFNLYSLLVAFVGACILIALLRAISGSRARQ
ncbi:MAG: GlsB/YeaQ/YmgE family stress response membrane protein [Thermomicrobiales bacterium]